MLALLFSLSSLFAQLPEGMDLSQIDLSHVDFSAFMQDPLSQPENDKYEIRRQDCTLPDGCNIYGIAYIPKGGNGKYPTLILSHGFGASHSALMGYGQHLAAQGIAVYTYDFSGGSNFSKSEGDIKQMSILTEADQLRSIFKQVQQMDFVDKKNIFISGESQGGMVSAMVGPEIQKKIRGMILLYPALNIPVANEAMFPDVNNIDMSKQPMFLWVPVSDKYVIESRQVNVTPLKLAFKKPVLIIHGDNDSLVPIEYSYQAVKDYPKSSLKVIKGAGHGFGGETLSEATGYMIPFIKANVK